GTPHVYYVGLLAGTGDLDLLATTGNGRDVNRHTYTPEELHEQLTRPVVRALLTMIQLRNTHPAFDGTPTHGRGNAPGSVELAWHNGSHHVRLEATPGKAEFRLTWTTPDGDRTAGTVEELAGA
ncbi:MAG TPA: hypothetical protein VFP72_15425, partial [Kineosporiaceae bacterium]|nr:hypothetical protein [Kineosporiaceae bacterium]